MPQPVGHGDDVSRNGLVGMKLGQLDDKRPVNLQAIDIQVSFPGQGGIARSEIIDGNMYAMGFQCGQLGIDFIDTVGEG